MTNPITSSPHHLVTSSHHHLITSQIIHILIELVVQMNVKDNKKNQNRLCFHQMGATNMKFSHRLIFLLFLVVWTANIIADDWPQYLGPGRNSV
jgi:hypothetical protein